MRFAPILLALSAIACGGTTADSHARRPLSDDAIAAFGAERSDSPPATSPEAPSARIELEGGEHLRELRALIRFDAGEGSDPSCALYTLRVLGEGLSEGRARVTCDGATSTNDVRLAPVEDTRAPRLVAALTGASLTPADPSAGGPSPRAVHLWLVTDRRELDGEAAPIRWPSPNAEATETPADRSPENLSEVWEAVMYPHRYR